MNVPSVKYMLHQIISEMIIAKIVVLLPILLYGLKVWMLEKSYQNPNTKAMALCGLRENSVTH